MKSLAFLVFLFLVVPGSGQLVWDGLPLSTRAEFAALAVLVLALLNKRMRASVGEFLGQRKWRGVYVCVVYVCSVCVCSVRMCSVCV